MLGETLDEKYRIESELGRGGMGTVYLATHLGTERPVAIKVIAPQFMQRPEFVERFRREARAAGRLRHPNVVDVTDFGFAATPKGPVAYLVMEYLDGCTLGEILEEENNLPVAWTLDILDQVCSAVQEAHSQGIIHRDLKPDNIWLEPNQRGGYTVKVLDFGIAKLESANSSTESENGNSSTPLIGGKATVAGVDGTIHDSISPTLISESGTVSGFAEAGTKIISVKPESDPEVSEKATAILEPSVDEDSVGTKIISDADDSVPHTMRSTTFDSVPTKDLTRVGAVLGTPLYMSPEQCRGEHLDARSDVYSLGVIAYQMLAGETPFTGDFTHVMDAHRDTPPPPLKARKVRKKLKRVIMSALAKDPAGRPQTAEGFALSLRSRSEGIWDLLRRSVMIYTEHLPKFLGITILLYLPFIILSLVNSIVGIVYVVQGIAQDAPVRSVVFGIMTTLSVGLSVLCGYFAVGTITWVVNQVRVVPLRPVRIRPSIKAAMRNWKRIVGTGILQTITIIFAAALCFFPAIPAMLLLSLVAPVVMMEGIKGFAAFKRSKILVMRSLRTTVAAVAILFFVPAIIGGITGGVVALIVDKGVQIAERTNGSQNNGNPQTAGTASNTEDRDGDIDIQIGNGRNSRIEVGENGRTRSSSMRAIAALAHESIQSLLMLPIQIIVTSLSAIIFALLYIKTRQAGGENLSDLHAQFEESGPQKKWQERVKARLIQSGRVASKPTG